MKPIKVLSIFGTRPEAIKMAPVIKQLETRPLEAVSLTCVTAQHREMLDQVIDLFDLVPDIDLNLMRKGQSPTQLAARVLSALEPILHDLQPDWVLVQGDTTTVMAAAITAHYAQVRVGHVEAGLRTYNRQNPFPEEMNRVVTDHISDLHFAPTSQARDHLLREGIPSEQIFITGNTVIDSLLQTANRPLTPDLQNWFCRHELNNLVAGEQSATPPGCLVLVTVHRRENHGQPIRQICAALKLLAASRPDLQIIYPVHRNPRVWEPVHALLEGVPGVTLVSPVDYFTLVNIMKCSKLVLTDSGGIQEEAPSLGVPVLVLRETTERPEAVSAGVARVVGTDPEKIIAETNRLLDNPAEHRLMARKLNPYGDGLAAKRIVDVLLKGKCSEFTGCEQQTGAQCTRNYRAYDGERLQTKMGAKAPTHG